jgi:PAS domain S-box-containing protein
LIIPKLIETQKVFIASKEIILHQWVSYDTPQKILKLHDINDEKFLNDYADGVFDYFMGVISGDMEIGDCPVMQSLLAYLKDRDIRADELFEICSHFRRSMIDFTYDVKLNSKVIFDEISFMFDKNFQGVLRYYTDTIFEKEQEINRNVKLLNEYQKALDESAIISKTDKDGKIIYINDKYIQLSGYSQRELIGKKHSIVKHKDMPQAYFDDLWFQLKHAGIFRGTIKNLKKNGDYFYIDVTIVKITDPSDNSIEYMSIANDVTTLIDARLEAQKASQAKEYFLSNMSHEIRTPLNAILGFVNLLIEQDISKQHRKYLDIIQNSGENLLSIINDILDFSKLRSGEFNIEPRDFSIHEEISHTLELFVASANSKDITITSFIDPTIPKELYADPLRVKQILSNLLSNSIKFTPSGGHISVEAVCEKGILKVSVKDDGIGIKKDDFKNIFSAFTQADNGAKKNLDGTGLGLSICYQLARHMGGNINFMSEFGLGSIFWVEVPVEIHNNECQIFNNLENLKTLKTVFYSPDGKNSYKAESFLKYSNIFNMKIDIVNHLDMDYDIAVFLEENIDDEFKQRILKSNKKYISLISKPNDNYEKYSHISCVCFPLYCSKIKSTFDELLNPESFLPHRQKNISKFIGHILVAEDNEANQELIKILLVKYGLSYDLAQNGLEAFELYKKNNYNLILMDEQMPVMDGNEAVRNIIEYEKLKELRHTPISALTANVIKGAKERGLQGGYDTFLGKPIIIKELEKLFFNYLKPANATLQNNPKIKSPSSSIKGLDSIKLSKELMLSEDELNMLVRLFIKKMSTQIPELFESIQKKDYKKISLIAHSIKGSSGNFRMQELQKITSEVENKAKNKDINYDYASMFEKIQDILNSIEIS